MVKRLRRCWCTCKDLAERITRTGIEVADIIDYSKDIKNVVVGYVTSKENIQMQIN